jgi:hypothetical protein
MSGVGCRVSGVGLRVAGCKILQSECKGPSDKEHISYHSLAGQPLYVRFTTTGNRNVAKKDKGGGLGDLNQRANHNPQAIVSNLRSWEAKQENHTRNAFNDI